MDFRLYHGKHESAITVHNVKGEVMYTITYSRRIHEYESNADYQSIRSQQYTYGDYAAASTFNYIRSTRNA